MFFCSFGRFPEKTFWYLYHLMLLLHLSTHSGVCTAVDNCHYLSPFSNSARVAFDKLLAQYLCSVTWQQCPVSTFYIVPRTQCVPRSARQSRQNESGVGWKRTCLRIWPEVEKLGSASFSRIHKRLCCPHK